MYGCDVVSDMFTTHLIEVLKWFAAWLDQWTGAYDHTVTTSTVIHSHSHSHYHQWMQWYLLTWLTDFYNCM